MSLSMTGGMWRLGDLADLLFLFALGIPGWLIFRRFHLPGAAILGPMLTVGLCRICGLGPAAVSPVLKPVLQVAIGVFIGLRVDRDTPRTLKGMAGVALTVSLWWMVSACLAGYALYLISPQLDLKTALLGSTPGGVAEMSLLAMSLGAHAPEVALLQFFRVVLVLVSVPALGPWLLPFLERLSGRREVCREAERPASTQAVTVLGSRPYVRTVMLGTAGGALLQLTGFPAGGLVGSMLGVGIARVAGIDCAALPIGVRSFAQVGLGGLIGLNFTSEMIRSFVGLVLPVLFLALVMLVFGFLLAVIVRSLTGWDIKTCIISTCAGGLTQMTAVSEDLGADPLTVTVLHVIRLITIVTVLPPLFALLLRT